MLFVCLEELTLSDNNEQNNKIFSNRVWMFFNILIIYTVAVGFYGLTELLFSNKKNDNDNLNQNKVCNYASSFNELDIDIKKQQLNY